MTSEVTNNSKVGLGQLQCKYNARSTSNMPSLLAEYGLPEAERPKSEPPKRRTRRVRIKISKENNFDKEENDTKAKARKEHYLQVYNDIQRLNQYHYEDHMQQLQDKVAKQRQEIKKRNEIYENKRKLKEFTKPPKKQPFRHDVTTDDSFLQGIPKSKYYKIVPLYDRLLASGCIRNTTDANNFWKNIRDPQVFDQIFRSEDGSDDLDPDSLAEILTREPDLTPMSPIKESHEPTPGPASYSQPKTSAPHKKALDPYTIARMAAIELDKKYPQLVLPKLSCFSTDLNEKPPDPVEVEGQLAKEQREKERLLFVKRIRRMYHLSQSNAASTQRIIDHHDSLFSPAHQTPDLEQLVSMTIHPVFVLAPINYRWLSGF
ncbi:hypothetical protein CAPTEDRAFT_186153 [Capitella teleta]|uniref:Uncharacterized protein n=1 Tax=Capitella teleta TaxID=283909 RepID=R7UC79_CAPTE|nr:hypothetical protein CAPTEDRAFT_186153 [Capitella teleta]|eukprot:ELU03599.1 hypothetical protein CAPTEDRAFT_186153 [Capitella teleta]